MKKVALKDFIFHIKGDTVEFEPNTADPELAEMIKLWRNNHPEIEDDKTAVGLMYVEAMRANKKAYVRCIVDSISAGRYEMSSAELTDAVAEDVNRDKREFFRLPRGIRLAVTNQLQHEAEERYKELARKREGQKRKMN